MREVQRDAAGSLRVSLNYSILPPRVGDRGLKTESPSALLVTHEVANSENKALDCARLFIDTSIEMMIGRTH